MKFVVVIPARYQSSRLPGKPLADIAGKTMIERVVDAAKTSDAMQVVVATDDHRIEEAVKQFDGEVCMTKVDHVSGSDRIVEVVEKYAFSDDVIIVNVQGDEPFIPGKLINQVAKTLIDSPEAVMSTASHAIHDEEDINNPNIVKVISNQKGLAMYFSRSPIPFAREQREQIVQKHIGIYAYRAGFLKRYNELPVSKIEATESLEQLRVLDQGEHIAVCEIDYDVGIGIDTPEDLEKARLLISGNAG